jgi:hypothetical protein
LPQKYGILGVLRGIRNEIKGLNLFISKYDQNKAIAAIWVQICRVKWL